MASQAYKRLGLLVVWLACFPGTADAQFQAWANQWGQHAFNAQAGRDYLGITNFHPGAGVTFTLTGPLHYTISANGVTFATNALLATNAIWATNWVGSNSMQVQITSVSNSVVTTSNSLQTQVTVVSNSLVTTSNVLQSQVTGLTNAFQTNAWHLNGNALGSTVPFLGSTDLQPVQFKVNNNQVGLLNTDNSIKLGFISVASAAGATALGYNAQATAVTATAVGYGGGASGVGAVGLGFDSHASGDYSFACGQRAGIDGMGISSVALGYNADAVGDYAFSGGQFAGFYVAGANSVNLGYYATGAGAFSFAAGNQAYAQFDGSFVWADSTGIGATVYDDVANQFVALASGGFKLISSGAGVNMDGPTYSTNKLTVTSGYVMATNFITSVPKWIDININYALSASGPTAPSLVSVTNPAADSLIKQLAFDNNDELFGQCQLPHNLAVTNSAFPAFYTEPHVHFDCKKAGVPSSTASNVTWRIEWEWANINGTWSRGTNQATMGITNNYTHYMLELGHITNNPPLTISAVFRCRLTRPASAAQEYDPAPNSHEVILDAFDLHVPVGNTNAIGSSSDNAP